MYLEDRIKQLDSLFQEENREERGRRRSRSSRGRQSRNLLTGGTLAFFIKLVIDCLFQRE